MTDKRFRIGLFATALWLLAIGSLYAVQHTQFLEMKPNEWGDFFAGSFAPLAFLWLVLGYLQQGEELKLSTQALLLQAEELRNSVEQQRALGEVSRQQVESEREALVYERNLRDEAAKPNILITSSGGSFRGDGVSNYSVTITNSGNIATDLLGELTTGEGSTFRLVDLPVFDRGAQHIGRFELPTPLQGKSSKLRLTYKDTLGRVSTIVFSVSPKTDHPHSELIFSKFEI